MRSSRGLLERTISETRAADSGGRWPGRLVGGLALALLATLASALSALATHTATVTNTPTSAPPLTSTSFTLSVTNNVSSTDNIVTVVLAVDASFTSVLAGIPLPPTGWSGTAAGNTITWTNSDGNSPIAPNTSKSFPWSATTGSAKTATHTWTTTDDNSGTATGTVTTTVVAASFYPLALAPVLLLYLLWLRQARRRIRYGHT